MFLPYHNRTQRFAVGVAHRRCGKTVACINDQIKKAITSDKERYRAAYIAPFLKQAKDVAWDYLKSYSAPIQAKPPNESELYVELINGARLRIYGADNAEALRGGYLDDADIDEYADMNPNVWPSIIRPMLADRQGTATFIGTPKGRNAFFQLYERAQNDPDWFSFFLPASQTHILPIKELEDARLDMTPEQYEQEFECSFDAAIMGAYYGKDIAQLEREGRITKVLYDPDQPVHTAWDLGVGDSTAIWFFQIGFNSINVIDFYENHGRGADHYVAELNSRPYKYGEDFVPHDAKVREWGNSGRQRIQVLIDMKRNPRLVPNHKVDDGINASRLTMRRMRFDKDKCALGIEALRQYRTEFDEKTRAFKNRPKHDWTSHAADAFRYMCMGYKDLEPAVETELGRMLAIANAPLPEGRRQVTWNDIHEEDQYTQRSNRI